jgi:hypothetical protein
MASFVILAPISCGERGRITRRPLARYRRHPPVQTPKFQFRKQFYEDFHSKHSERDEIDWPKVGARGILLFVSNVGGRVCVGTRPTAARRRWRRRRLSVFGRSAAVSRVVGVGSDELLSPSPFVRFAAVAGFSLG